MKLHTRANMKRRTMAGVVGLLGLGMVASASAGETTTSASAGMGRFGPGTSTATAAYSGNGQGIANTNTRSGNNFTFGRGVAFGIDEDGVSLSASHAIATRYGPAVASTFNLTIGFDGAVASAHGGSIAAGGAQRTAFAGGSSGIHRQVPTATANAGGRTVRGGVVRAHTDTRTHRAVASRGIARLRR